MEYLDFELEVDIGTGREYPVSVVRSPAGEARATMVFPFDTLALRNHLQALEIALLRSSGTYRRAAPPEGAAVQEFGKALFAALLPSDIRGRYVVSREKAAAQGKGLRLKLRVRPPELAALPWEFLYDPDEADYICLSRSTPLVRYLEMPGAAQPLAIAPPLRVLAMVSSPSDMQSLDTARERQRVDEAMKDLVAAGRVELHWLEGQTWRHLQEAMWGGPWHVFHFIGHGGFDTNSESGLLVLADDQGRAHKMTAEQVALLLNDHESLRLVLLNSCDGARAGDEDIFSSSAATLIRRGIPAVLAMQYEITDAAAIEFSRTFYRATAHGMPVDAAVAEARRAIRIGLGGSLEWGTPVLYMRSGDGRLFDLQGDPVAVATPPEEPPPPMPAEDELERGPTPKGEPRPAGVGEALGQLAGDEPKPTVYVNLGLPEGRGWRDKLASRWRYSMVIVNGGQEPVEVGLSAAGRDKDSCVITMPDAVTVLAGAQRYVPIEVRPKKRRLFGKLKAGGFTVTASGDGPDLPVTQQGYFSDSPSPLGMLGVGAVGLVAVLAGVGVVIAGLGGDDEGGGDAGEEGAAAQETAAALDPGGPTGQIGFVSYRGGLERIYLVDADRSGEELLTPPGWTAVNPAWSPDGTILAFASDADGDYDIYVMRLGEEPVKVTENPTEDSAPTWSA
ncbi:MAG TPA: CHAT domain-containing protein, partial [Tepidiformaceae bacterium]|nr:CHAT domain-containing protein [Tepidiformaceae bacterium]